jgi:hypothetical protein
MRAGSRVPLQIRHDRRSAMLDLLFLALGVGIFALFGAYAIGLRRI